MSKHPRIPKLRPNLDGLGDLRHESTQAIDRLSLALVDVIAEFRHTHDECAVVEVAHRVASFLLSASYIGDANSCRLCCYGTTKRHFDGSPA